MKGSGVGKTFKILARDLLEQVESHLNSRYLNNRINAGSVNLEEIR